MNVLAMPPLGYGERFEEVYEVILILDDREHFASQGSVISDYRIICFKILKLHKLGNRGRLLCCSCNEYNLMP